MTRTASPAEPVGQACGTGPRSRAPSFVGPQDVAAGIAGLAWIVLALASGSHDHGAGNADVLGFLGTWTLMVVAMMVPATSLRTHRAASMVANVVVWGAFGLAALAVERLPYVALSPAVVLVLAGLYQLSPAKRRLLARARPPDGLWRHTVSCLGSCWALMLVMFAIGSLALMTALTVVMVAERLVRGVAVLAGVVLLVAAVPVAVGW